MKNTDQTPKYKVVEEKGWIPARDGTRLAATFYRPDSDERFPALFEFLPYRKDDGTVTGSNLRYYWFAERGYVGVRVDVRGTGSSEGAPAENEYVLQEQLDGYDCIEWLAEQEWCTGRVGMQGGSYGGFNSVLVASQNPPHLTAISPWMYADDGYTDGDHFEGGCLSALGLCYYGLIEFTRGGLPADPVYFEEEAGTWEEMWLKRLEQYEPWVLDWFDHQTNDAFWRVQSLRPDYDSIKCPVFMIGGWGDHFRNAIPRMLEHMDVPMKAIIGPWVHALPQSGDPGPNIDFHYHLLRWWDYWLKGIDNGIMDEPSLTVYVQRDRPPGMFAEYAEGYWRYEDGWPLEDGVEDIHYLHASGLLAKEAPTIAGDSHAQYVYRPDVGVASNVWFSQANTLGEEQNLDEAYSLTFTSARLEEDLEILGFPLVKLYVASTAENTAFVAKLTEVNSVGQSNLITYGILNGAHRNSHEQPEALEPGEIYALDIKMSAISWIFKKGHRIRLSVTSSHWPIVWPLPEPAVNRVYADKDHTSTLTLPVVPVREAPRMPDLAVPAQKGAPIPNVARVPGGRPLIKITRNVNSNDTIAEVKGGGGFTITDRDLSYENGYSHKAQTSNKDPALSSVSSENYVRMTYANGLTVNAVGMGTVSSNKKQFLLHLYIKVELNGKTFFDKTWLKTVPRYFI